VKAGLADGSIQKALFDQPDIRQLIEEHRRPLSDKPLDSP
jgi:hypothetical protein